MIIKCPECGCKVSDMVTGTCPECGFDVAAWAAEEEKKRVAESRPKLTPFQILNYNGGPAYSDVHDMMESEHEKKQAIKTEKSIARKAKREAAKKERREVFRDLMLLDIVLGIWRRKR